jgi:hypothetical protein
VHQWAPGRHFINAYGPTEITVCASLHHCDTAVRANVPIGRPLPNVRIYILDPAGEPVPIGIHGEIHIGGAGVARGYLRRPELTAQRFLVDPFVKGGEERLYRTGDVARWRPDGTIEYLGRNDSQVKLRGFRIELGEIETQLLRLPTVREAIVVALQDPLGEKRLVGYVTCRDGEPPPNTTQLRAHLQSALPEHMIPSTFLVLEHLPTTPNGKIDRKSLPLPSTDSSTSDYEAPEGEVEQVLSEVWKELLRVDRVGRDDNFFELGGHSLHVVKLNAKVSQRLGVRLSVPMIFRYPSVRKMAAAIEPMRVKNEPRVSVAEAQYEDGIL